MSHTTMHLLVLNSSSIINRGSLKLDVKCQNVKINLDHPAYRMVRVATLQASVGLGESLTQGGCVIHSQHVLLTCVAF
jgi:hypothetical protein